MLAWRTAGEVRHHVEPARVQHTVKVLIQRVAWARVVVDAVEVSRIARGMLLLVGVERGDAEREALAAADKVAGLRIFPDAAGKMNFSLADIGGAVLVVSQFTLAGSLRKGRRPSFEQAAEPELARRLVDRVASELSARGLVVGQGVFAAEMQVELLNDGPVTFLLDLRASPAGSD